MESVQDRVKLLQSESTQLKQFLHALPQEAWSQPSACGHWQIQDVVTHLAGAAESYVDWISRGLRGDPSPPAGRPPAGSGNAGSTAAGIAERVISRREQLGDQLLTTFETSDDALNRLLAGIGPQDWERPCYQPIGQIPVRRFIDLRLQELVIHGWDIRSRLMPDAPLSPESLPGLMDMLAFLTPGWAFWPGTKRNIPVRYRFDVTGTVSNTIDIVVEGDKASIAARSDAIPDVNFRCETEAYVLMRYGRISLEDAQTSGRVTVEGDHALALAFSEWFRGI